MTLLISIDYKDLKHGAKTRALRAASEKRTDPNAAGKNRGLIICGVVWRGVAWCRRSVSSSPLPRDYIVDTDLMKLI